MRFPRALILLTALVLLVQACGDGDEIVSPGAEGDGTDIPSGQGDDGGTRPSIAGNWVLTSLASGGSAVEIPAGAVLEMTIEAGEIRGDAGCNHYGGTIEAGDDGSVHLTDLAWTEMACEPRTLMDFEQVHLGALVEATTWEVTPDALVFRGEGVELVYAMAAADPDLPLEQTVWTFDTVYGDGEGPQRAASTPRMDKPKATLVIAEGEATLISDDCGPVSFPFTYEPGGDGNVTLPDPAAAEATCDDADSNLLTALAGITEATGYMIHEARLTFIGLPGETVSFTGTGS
jgi:heat shock protein HslJ